MDPLKEAQIHSWWSTYHQKRKRSISVLQEEAANSPGHVMSSQQSTSATSVPSQQPVQSAPVIAQPQQPLQSITVTASITAASSQQCIEIAPVPPQVTSVPPQQPVTSATVSTQVISPPPQQGLSTAASTCLIGHTIPAIPGIVQWSFTADFSQSTLGGRCSSNACTFIAFYFGYLYLIDNLPPPLGDALSVEWKCALYKAMKKGNEIHDELFEGEAVDAVSMAGTECFVDSIGESLDAFGQDCRDQLAAVFEMLCSTQLSRCSAFVSMRRTMLFVVNQDSSCMIIDSHKHGNNGALIAFCPPKSSKMLVEWLQGMFQETWQSDLRVCSVIPISYVTH